MQSLGKWPTIVIVGQPVTPRQAQHILVRCRSWDMMWSNNKGWLGEVTRAAMEELDLPRTYDREVDGDLRRWNAEYTAWCERYGILGWISADSLECDLFTSSYHSWCWPDGMIGGQLSIGKWPDEDSVHEELTTIAKQFPWLRLEAHLVPEGDTEYTEAHQYRMRDGQVEMTYGSTPELEFPDGFDYWWGVDRMNDSAMTIDEIRAALRAVREDS